LRWLWRIIPLETGFANPMARCRFPGHVAALVKKLRNTVVFPQFLRILRVIRNLGA